MLYTYKRLNSIMREVKNKGKNVNPVEAAIGIAAAYAVDLMDIGREIGKPLDLSVHTTGNLGECIMRAHFQNMAGNHTVEESREILTKMLASYEMFMLVNDFGSLKETQTQKELVSIVVLHSVMMPTPKLVLETIPDKSGHVHRFDINDMAREAMADIHLGNPRNGEKMFFAGSLQPFHQRVNSEVVGTLAKIVKSE